MADEKVVTDEEFRAQVKAWCVLVRNQAKRNAASFPKGKSGPHTYIRGRYAGKSEGKLKDNVGYVVGRRGGDVDHVSFKIPVHGIFREYGVGNGQPRNGSYSSNKRANKVYIKRSMSDWLHDPIDRNLGKFADLVAEYYGDKMMINFKKL